MSKAINIKITKLEEMAYANVQKVTLVRRHHRQMTHAGHELFHDYEIDACSCNGFCGGNFRYDGCSCYGFCGSNSRKD